MAFSFIFNDLNSLSEDLIVESIPAFPSFLEADNFYTIIFAYKYNSDDNLRKYIKLKNYLKGQGKLKISLANDIFLKVESVIFKEIEKNKEYVVNSVDFKIEPYIFYERGQKVININTPNFNLFNSYEESEPRLKVYGNGLGQFIVNGNSFNLDIRNGYMIIDSDLKDVFWENGLLNNYINGAWPILKKGLNNISFSGGITKIELIPNWRC